MISDLVISDFGLPAEAVLAECECGAGGDFGFVISDVARRFGFRVLHSIS
jgi:hypothetical protein